MSKTPEQSFKFFQNKACMYFPCHPNADEETFNCLFCYCPLYFLGDKCKGNYRWIDGVEGRIKDCTNCLIPHIPDNYSYMVNLLGENMEQ